MKQPLDNAQLGDTSLRYGTSCELYLSLDPDKPSLRRVASCISPSPSQLGDKPFLTEVEGNVRTKLLLTRKVIFDMTYVSQS
jgi:hypothetical protein